ncbi:MULTISPECIES: glucuronyl esterase domain-containing protein [Sorangium]|uniref:glucuronyl esterase domain-containing protein n=1 Tax=Sorangium TaxID=39643 RepID=UPI003D9C6834
MSKKSQWRCRRAELKKAVEKYIHGEKPGRPDKVTGSVSSTSIAVRVEHGGKSIEFSVSVSLPRGASGPVPAIIGLGGGSLDKSLLAEEGVATINYNNNAMSSETGRTGLFSNIYGNTGASAQVGWAWGVSRIIDVLVDERDAGRNDIIDPTAIGVTGCSRLGKGAFTIGAFDERIALGIPQESGTGGVSAFRVVNTNPVGPNGKPAQSLSSAWSEAQGWFGTVFGSYRDKVNVIPADTHSLVAMYAPRGLLVLDNSRIGELGSVAQHAATAAGGEVYKALGVEKNVAYHGGRPSDPHNHCGFYPEQAEPLRRAIRAHLTRTADPDGRMEPQPVATADLAAWIDWDTPALE